MATRLKQGKYGMTRPRVSNILGTVKICNHRLFSDTKGEIIARRNDYMQYLTIQIPSEYRGRVYVLNLLYSQCEDIRWR